LIPRVRGRFPLTSTYYFFKIFARSFLESPISLRSNFCLINSKAFLERNAGGVGPIYIPLILRYNKLSNMATAFCSNHIQYEKVRYTLCRLRKCNVTLKILHCPTCRLFTLITKHYFPSFNFFHLSSPMHSRACLHQSAQDGNLSRQIKFLHFEQLTLTSSEKISALYPHLEHMIISALIFLGSCPGHLLFNSSPS
jgi:hypothetical protein